MIEFIVLNYVAVGADSKLIEVLILGFLDLLNDVSERTGLDGNAINNYQNPPTAARGRSNVILHIGKGVCVCGGGGGGGL